jgi:hypothetical protein
MVAIAIISILVAYALFGGSATAETYDENIWSLTMFSPFRNASLPLSDPASIIATFDITPTIRNTCRAGVTLTTPWGQTWPLCPLFRRDGLSAVLSFDSADQTKQEWRTCQRWKNMPFGFDEILPQHQAKLKWRIRDVVEEEVTMYGLRSVQLEVVQVISWDIYIPKSGDQMVPNIFWK